MICQNVLEGLKIQTNSRKEESSLQKIKQSIWNMMPILSKYQKEKALVYETLMDLQVGTNIRQMTLRSELMCCNLMKWQIWFNAIRISVILKLRLPLTFRRHIIGNQTI